MAYGMQIYNTDNSLAYDSTSPGGVFLKFILMPAGTTYIDSPKIELLPVEYAYNADRGPIPQHLVVIPTVHGDHNWYVNHGYYSTGQVPYLTWNDKTHVVPYSARRPTVLMVFGT